MDEALAALRNEIDIEAAGSQAFQLEAFARVFARRLEESEQLFDLNVEVLRCRGPRGRSLEVLGYGEDETDSSLVLLAGRFFGDDSTLTLSEAKTAMSRATGFLESAVDGWLEENLEPSSREAEYADYFARVVSRGSVTRLRVVMISDGIMSNRIKTIPSEEVAGLRASFEIWDQRRLLDAARPERGSEDIHVDFTKWLPDGLPCLVADSTDDSTQTYLAVIPAKVLADVFDEFGSLLLESNVRTYLSARGAVNKGIQATLSQEPDRFLAYNNGLTTTATSVAVTKSSGGASIRSIDRWQIVNGGQTTSSIAHYLRANKQRDVDNVSVQMKIVTISDDDAMGVVQSIARYANSQNRISAADLFSTHEFHIRLEQISRRLRALAKEGEQYRTGWYYERARGQWENDRTARGTAAAQKAFELEFPRAQRVTKTDWAKYAYCWSKKPHLVSRGAQSVFAEYATAVDDLWQKDSAQFNDGYFRTGIGKAILFNAVRTAVLREDWYRDSPGYLANIIAYAISRFSLQLDAQFRGQKYDFERVWQTQTLSESTLDSLLEFARRAQAHLTDPRRPQANVTQWAKQLACWEKFSQLEITIQGSVINDLASTEELRVRGSEDRQQRVMDSGFESISKVLSIDQGVWEAISTSLSLSPMERDLVQLFGLTRGRVPTERQAAALLRLLKRGADSGAVPRHVL